MRHQGGSELGVKIFCEVIKQMCDGSPGCSINKEMWSYFIYYIPYATGNK
jgi:hypothetical protein